MEADKFGSKGTGKGQGNRVAGLDLKGKIQAGRRQKKNEKNKKNALKTKEGNKHLPKRMGKEDRGEARVAIDRRVKKEERQ